MRAQNTVSPQRGGGSKLSLQSRLGCLAMHLASVSNIWSLSQDAAYTVCASELAMELGTKPKTKPLTIFIILCWVMSIAIFGQIWINHRQWIQMCLLLKKTTRIARYVLLDAGTKEEQRKGSLELQGLRSFQGCSCPQVTFQSLCEHVAIN